MTTMMMNKRHFPRTFRNFLLCIAIIISSIYAYSFEITKNLRGRYPFFALKIPAKIQLVLSSHTRLGMSSTDDKERELYDPDEPSFRTYKTKSGKTIVFDGEDYAEMDEDGWARIVEPSREDQYDRFDIANPFNIDPDEIGRESIYLADWNIEQLASDYSFPIHFFVDVLCRWGVPPPIDTKVRLREVLNTQQAVALSEALTSLDRAEIYDCYLDYDLQELSEIWEVPLADIFQVCGLHNLNLPLGVKTHMQIDDYKFMMQELGIDITGEGESFNGRHLPDMTSFQEYRQNLALQEYDDNSLFDE